MEFTAAQIAQFVQGRVEGDENATVNTFAKSKKARKALSRSFQTLNILTSFMTQSRASYSSTKPWNWIILFLPPSFV